MSRDLSLSLSLSHTYTHTHAHTHTDWQSVLSLCQGLYTRYSSLLSPLNIVKIKLLQEILEAQLEVQKWTEALDTAELLLKPYQ